MLNDASSLVAVTAVCYWLIDMAKKASWFPVLQVDAGKVNKFAAALLASLASAGIVFHIVHVGTLTAGTITIDYSGLTLANVVAWGYHAIAYYAGMKGIHGLSNLTATANGK